MDDSVKAERADNAPEAVLELRQVGKRFVAGKRTVQALRHVSLAVQPGRVTGLIGPDGAGKTTLMRLAVGLLAPDEGAIRTLGFDATHESLAVQANVGYMPQRFGLYEDLSVQENLDLYADLQGVPEGERPSRYEELMRMTGLARFTGRLAGRLSGGMKQKLGLACTLVRPPRLLLLDEPTVGVDPVSRRELWQIVYRLVRQEGMTVLLSTAYLDEAERCEEVLLMHEGELVGHGPPRQFREQARGRTYLVSAPGQRKRAVQARLAAAAPVVDALDPGRARAAGYEQRDTARPRHARARPARGSRYSRRHPGWRTVLSHCLENGRRERAPPSPRSAARHYCRSADIPVRSKLQWVTRSGQFQAVSSIRCRCGQECPRSDVAAAAGGQRQWLRH